MGFLLRYMEREQDMDSLGKGGELIRKYAKKTLMDILGGDRFKGECMFSIDMYPESLLDFFSFVELLESKGIEIERKKLLELIHGEVIRLIYLDFKSRLYRTTWKEGFNSSEEYVTRFSEILDDQFRIFGDEMMQKLFWDDCLMRLLKEEGVEHDEGLIDRTSGDLFQKIQKRKYKEQLLQEKKKKIERKKKGKEFEKQLQESEKKFSAHIKPHTFTGDRGP